LQVAAVTAPVPAGPSPPATPTKTPATRRNVELLLLLFAFSIVLALSVAVQAAQEATITPAAAGLPAGLGLLFLLAHLAVRWLAPYADPVILPCVCLLNGLGVIFIARLGAASAKNYGGQGVRQLFWTLGSVLFFAGVLYLVRDHRALARFAYTAGLIGIVLVMLPAVLPSRFSQINNAKLWIIIPGIGQIQPGEFAKLALMVFFASYLVAKRDVLSLASKRFVGIDLPRGRDLGPVVGAWLASLLVLVFERDLGTSLMYFGIFVVMLYIATERTSWLLIGLLLFAGGAYAAWMAVPTVQLRVAIWLDPFATANGSGYQLVQSLFGLGTGGLFGTGPGAGQPEQVPFASSDFIVSTIGEEAGLFGLAAVLTLYMMLTARGIRVSLDVRDSFGKLLAGGLAFSVGLQVFVIVGGVSKLIPLTGLTTPFLSYGGSSLIANWCLVAILLRISDAGRRPTAVNMPVQLRHAPTEVVRL
jgi:cell division protein FtsW (lipid II flippase)